MWIEFVQITCDVSNVTKAASNLSLSYLYVSNIYIYIFNAKWLLDQLAKYLINFLGYCHIFVVFPELCIELHLYYIYSYSVQSTNRNVLW